MDAIGKLADLFERFPGIGPRQARRFVLFLLRMPPGWRDELAVAIRTLGSAVKQCPSCMRFHDNEREQMCDICRTRRESPLLMVVATDTDVSVVEQTGTYDGTYFVLGGTVALGSERALPRAAQLTKRIGDNMGVIEEIILALPANPEGDLTAEFAREQVRSQFKDANINITTLGRGLSTGSELEYADPETIKNALSSRG